MFSHLHGLGLNFGTFPRDLLYQLQDGSLAELCLREGHVAQQFDEQRLTIDQLIC